MRTLFLIIVLGFQMSVYSQFNDTIVLKQNDVVLNKGIYKCILGDTAKMKLSFNNKFYQFKTDLPDGLYVAFFDKTFKDTALVSAIQNGNRNGLEIRWEEGNIVEIFEYRDNLRNGWGKEYLYTKEYGRLVNISFCEDDVCTELYTEW